MRALSLFSLLARFILWTSAESKPGSANTVTYRFGKHPALFRRGAHCMHIQSMFSNGYKGQAGLSQYYLSFVRRGVRVFSCLTDSLTFSPAAKRRAATIFVRIHAFGVAGFWGYKAGKFRKYFGT